MQLEERQKAFDKAVKAHFGVTRHTKVNQAFGVSNSAKVIEGGIQLGVPNLDNWAAEDVDGFVLLCVIRFPPEDEVYFAVQVRSGIPDMGRRLAEMRRLGAEAKAREAAGAAADENEAEGSSELVYSARNNLAVAYLAQDGKLYFRNKGFWSSLKFDLSTVGPAVPVDGVTVAIYPPAASARRSMLAREFVGYLGKFVGRQKVHELDVWPDVMAVSPAMRRMPAEIPAVDIRKDVEALGGHYVDGLVERFHESLNFLPHKHFVILSGLSGTGKTQLALQYARAVHGLKSMDEPDPLLRVCSVRPEWTDPSGLTGYHDMLTNKYVVPPFLEAVLLATAHRDSPVFVVLDELNLAKVEYYFADILSAMETRGNIQLHSSGVPIEGSTGGEIRAELPFPSNLFLVGTINVDESTNPVSDKVLDRATVIDMTQVDLPGFITKLSTRFPDLAPSSAALGDLLAALNAELLPNMCGFGYRVAEEIVRYHAFAALKLGRDANNVIDDMLAQKVLVKLRGGHAQRPMLANLGKLLGDYQRSRAIIQRMADELDELGSFRYGR
jgi:5-methylcytosine-specific restriction enzyme B